MDMCACTNCGSYSFNVMRDKTTKLARVECSQCDQPIGYVAELPNTLETDK